MPARLSTPDLAQRRQLHDAMRLLAAVTCPQCGSSRCRTSKWLSREEKQLAYPDSQPYRCRDCSHRFIYVERTSAEKVVIVAAVMLFLVIVLTSVASFWLRNPDEPPDLPAAEALTPEADDLKAAQAGDPEAQVKVGEVLFRGAHLDHTKSAEALHWLQLAADNGNTRAMVRLGKMNRSGVGILQNFSESARWMQTAADRGDAEGMLELGRLYRDGVGVEKDPVSAYMWFNRAAAAHNLDAVREREATARMLNAEELNRAQHQSAALATANPAHAPASTTTSMPAPSPAHAPGSTPASAHAGAAKAAPK